MKVFSTTPFLRILPATLVGIAIGNCSSNPFPFSICLLVYALVCLLNYWYVPRKWFKYLWHFSLDSCVCLCFLFLTIQHNEQRFDQKLTRYQGKDVIVLFKVLEVTTHYEKSARTKIQITALWHNNQWVGANETTMANFPVGTTVYSGISYAASGLIKEVNKATNEAEFDYKRYLLHHDIRFTVIIEKYASYKSFTDFQSTCLGYKERIIQVLNKSLVSKRVSGIAIALITGFSKQINSQDTEAFATTGTLHILSVSGLHVGLIYSSASALLLLVVKDAKKKWLVKLIPLVLIWLFSFVAGGAPPVIRSSIMCSLLAFAQISNRRYSGNQVNVLLFSAIILLVTNPNHLLDNGFQLSYTAMLGIFLFQAPFETLFEFKYTISKYLYTSIITSVAATLGTLPISLYLFHQFPPLFIISNLIIVPLSFALLIVCLCLLVGFPLAPKLLSYGTEWMLAINQFLSELGCIQFLPVDAVDAWCLGLIEISLLYALYKVKIKSLKRSLYFIVFILLIDSFRFIDHFYHAPMVLLHSQNNSCLNVPVGKANRLLTFTKTVHSKHMTYFLIQSSLQPQIIRNWSKLVTKKGVIKLINSGDQTELADVWLLDCYEIPEEVDFARFRPKQLILLKRLKQGKKRNLQELCVKFGCRFMDATDLGTIRIDI